MSLHVQYAGTDITGQISWTAVMDTDWSRLGSCALLYCRSSLCSWNWA